MKKTLVALAVLASAGAASAQSSVTLFGIVDAGVAYIGNSSGNYTTGNYWTQTGTVWGLNPGAITTATVANATNKRIGMTNSGLNSSRLGFKGVEDLGGGLKAGFWLEGGLGNDDGIGAATGGGLTFTRRSYVNLAGNFGEIRLGREYTPSFWNLTIFDPFGTNGIGSNMTIGMLGGLLSTKSTNTFQSNWTDAVRANNSITYLLPSTLGGFYGQAMYSFGEKGSPLGAAATNASYWGARAGFANYGFDGALGYGEQKGSADGSIPKWKSMNVGLSYDAGFVKPMFLWAQEKAAGTTINGYELGATAPLGAGELRAAYSMYKVKSLSALNWSKFALGYGYNLSKRTQVYGTGAYLKNKSGESMSISNTGTGIGLAAPGMANGGSSKAVEFGIRHSF